jgi:hypothetical protein
MFGRLEGRRDIFMLKTALIAMTVVGCDCDAKMCEFVRATPPEWSTVAECEEALKSRAVRDADAGYPLIIAICRSTEESPARLATAIDPAMTAATTTTIPAQHFETSETRSIVMRASDRYVVARNAVTGFAGSSAELVSGVAIGTVDALAEAAGTTVGAVGGAAGWVYDKATGLF